MNRSKSASDRLATYHKDHWIDIEPERFERYETMFQLDDKRADLLMAAVEMAEGETVVDFGCGPGHVAANLARVGGPRCHVHAVDVNPDFVARAREVVDTAGVGDRVTVHHAPSERIPLDDGVADRAYAKNVLEYVPDLGAVLGELGRLLRPGGQMVATDSDFGFVVIEPLSPAEVAEVFDAAAPAFKEPNVGRKLRSAYIDAGFTDVAVKVTAAVDTTGHLRAMVENMLGYGLQFGRMTTTRADELRAKVDAAVADGTFLAVLPQWWVKGSKPSA